MCSIFEAHGAHCRRQGGTRGWWWWWWWCLNPPKGSIISARLGFLTFWASLLRFWGQWTKSWKLLHVGRSSYPAGMVVAAVGPAPPFRSCGWRRGALARRISTYPGWEPYDQVLFGEARLYTPHFTLHTLHFTLHPLPHSTVDSALVR